MITALMKQMKVKRLISRTVSPLQKTILKAMRVTQIINPEEENALQWAKKLNFYSRNDSIELNEEYIIIETKVPEVYYDLTVEEADIRKDYHIIILSTYNLTSERNEIGTKKS